MSEEQKWPDAIWLVRHGESAGNVARNRAEAEGRAVIEIAQRDVDVDLSELGERQARALGRWFGSLPKEQQPTVVLASPYVRARRTAQLVMQANETDAEDLTMMTDERIREKEFGVFDRLTKRGIQEKYPDLAEMRTALGKFYHRPPGGESWCDVILRLRSVIDTLTREYRRERVLIVSHQVVVNCFRYLFERMTEEQILAVDREADVPNCSVTGYEFDKSVGKHGKLVLRAVNFVAPLEEAGAAVTSEPDAAVAPK